MAGKRKITFVEAEVQRKRARIEQDAWPLVSVDERMGLVIVTDRESPDAERQTMWVASLTTGGVLLAVERQKRHRFIEGLYNRERRWIGDTLTMAPVMPARVKAKIDETLKARGKK